jgi:hypothetical protein
MANDCLSKTFTFWRALTAAWKHFTPGIRTIRFSRAYWNGSTVLLMGAINNYFWHPTESPRRELKLRDLRAQFSA